LLSIVLAPTSADYAAKLRGAVNYETQVTWNEPSSTATDPPIISTLVKIIIAIGVFMMVTLVLGIAFGGVRIITKRLFPGKVFDRKEQIEVLQLGLSGKPIDPSDMY
jgi:predicted small integral membrane protein